MREALALLLLVASLGSPASPPGVAAKNLGFEEWDARGRPEGWRVPVSADHVLAADCASGRAGCALRIEGLPNAARGSYLPIAQPIGAKPVAGHRVRLSGWIRTAGVEQGWAGLWMRADVEGKTMALENMRREGPRGTSGWARHEIAVDVPSNATLVSFGVLLAGGGTAWFDDLELTVDPAVTVGRAVRPEVVVPPRPRPSNEHVPDASLAIGPGELPRVGEAWARQARAAARPIRSLFSDDFSDLQFLKPLLAGRRVVMLGESGHGVAEFNWMKVRLVRFLHREMGFDVVAFESSMTGCDIADARIGRSAPADVMRDAIFGVWHSSETLALFEYLDAERRAGRPIALAGFDVQNSGHARAAVSARLLRQLERVDAELAARIAGYERELTPALAAARRAEMREAYAGAAGRLVEHREALRKLEARPVEVDLAIQELRSRVRYVEALAGGMDEAGVRARDQGMADNLEFVLDRLHPGRKVIVWAHNSHIARSEDGRAGPLMMGSWLAERRGAEIYSVGLFMGWGIAARNDRVRYEIFAPPPDSLEAILANGGWRLAFFDLTRSPPAWAATPLDARTWGVAPIRMTPARAYDALIYIDAVTPPEYL